MAHFPFSAFVSAFCAVTIGIFLLINSKQPKPYLDEIFHVPQAQKYCQYRFTEWDPKITTLPGLYLTTFAVLKTFAFFSKQELTIVCSALFLRLTNLIFFVGNIWILRKLVMSLNVRPSEVSVPNQCSGGGNRGGGGKLQESASNMFYRVRNWTLSILGDSLLNA